jgi:hypothetical protein
MQAHTPPRAQSQLKPRKAQLWVVGQLLEIWRGAVGAFRTFCYEPGEQGKSILLAIPQITPLFSFTPTDSEARIGR